MRSLFVLLTVLATAAPAFASGESGVMAPIRQFINGFNTGNMRSAVAACDSTSSVIDDFPPHVWPGPRGCADWARAYTGMANFMSITSARVILGTARDFKVTKDRAYVVLPAAFTYKAHGKPVTENGARFTFALRRVGAGWRITGWAWTTH